MKKEVASWTKGEGNIELLRKVVDDVSSEKLPADMVESLVNLWVTTSMSDMVAFIATHVTCQFL